MAKAKVGKKKSAKKPVKKAAKKAQASEVRLPLTAPERVVPAPRPLSAAQRMPMPVSNERPIRPVQLRQPSLFQRELPPHNDTK